MNPQTTLDYFFSIYPAGLIVSLAILVPLVLYFLWKVQKANNPVEDKTPKEFKAPRLNTLLEDAKIELGRAREELEANKLNLGKAFQHLRNINVLVEAVPNGNIFPSAEEKKSFEFRHNDLLVMVGRMMAAALEERGKHLRGRLPPSPA